HLLFSVHLLLFCGRLIVTTLPYICFIHSVFITISFFFSSFRLPPRSTLFPYTTLFRSIRMLGIGPGRERLVIGGASLFLFGLSIDRKSTRLNSSHVKISYAVFCLKKKKKYFNINTITSALKTHKRVQ